MVIHLKIGAGRLVEMLSTNGGKKLFKKHTVVKPKHEKNYFRANQKKNNRCNYNRSAIPGRTTTA